MEDFLTFEDVTGLGLATTLQKLGFNLNKLREQGYDGSSAMKGSFRNYQRKILKSIVYPLRFPFTESLSDATKIQEIRNNFVVISRITILKNKILEIKKNVQITKIKSSYETRWVLHHESVLIYKEFSEPIVAALEQLKTDSTRTNKNCSDVFDDIYTKSKAITTLLKSKKPFKYSTLFN
ncbi:Hypothetical protein CINCED_3A018098 [Cinara cedri]|uniref:Uncharacterized protein n=1 Tax=Cinara cedri TaxID=506608 RepID=A0A5E4M775_9HEMI|nr:Hypothetical protein CINCED_3A018098 [Cinara cedri]